MFPIRIAAAATLGLLAAPSLAQVSDPVARTIRADIPRPRLTVVLSIDQFRGDYLTRFSDLFLPAMTDGKPGGFRYLMDQGAYFANARFEHLPLFTGPGHAVLLTGAHPYKSGIISNEWWDPHQQRVVYCVEDGRFKVVGAAEGSHARPMGPANLHSTTVGDELKLATGNRSKVITLAVKDRAAVLMGGHAQDLSLWFDSAGGRWISSTAYCREGHFPAWVESLNDEHIPDQALGTQWTPSIAQSILDQRSIQPKAFARYVKPIGEHFPHSIGPEKTSANYHAFILNPAANAFVFESAQRAITAEKLGQRDTPDLLAISLSSNDYIGHAFGPYSPEALDLTLRADAQLASFLNFIDHTIPGGLKSTVFVLTADHGSNPIPEDAAEQPYDLDSGRFPVRTVVDAIQAALAARFGPAPDNTWFAHSKLDPKHAGAFLDGLICLNPDAVAQAIADGKARSRRDIEQAACDAINGAGIPGVYGLYGKTQILEGAIADNDLRSRLAKGTHPQLASDLILIPDQLYLQGPDPEGHATSHGGPWSGDTHVPVILCSPGLIRPGIYTDPVAPSDIAPTLSLLLGIEFPSGCDGRPLHQALMP